VSADCPGPLRYSKPMIVRSRPPLLPVVGGVVVGLAGGVVAGGGEVDGGGEVGAFEVGGGVCLDFVGLAEDE
jgi:hypothetical protein